MVLNSTRYLSLFQQYEVPVLMFQKRKPVMDRELVDSQFLRMTDGWRQNIEKVGESVVKEGFALAVNGSNNHLIDIPAFEAVFDDGIAVSNKKTQNVNVSGLTAGTYDVLASVTYALRDSTVDADLKDPTYGIETTQMLNQLLTLSVLASTPANRTADATMVVSGSSGSGPTLRYTVKSTVTYTSNEFALGSLQTPDGQRWAIEDQQDNTPLPGQTTFVLDPGPDQSGLVIAALATCYLIPPYPFYGPVRTSAVRYLKLGTVTVTGIPPLAIAASVTTTVSTYKAAKDMRTAFLQEHFTGGSHGPKVTITQTGADNALNIIQGGNDNAVGIVNNGNDSAIIIQQNTPITGAAVVEINHTASSGRGIQIDITNAANTNSLIFLNNSGSGNDIRGTNDSWHASKEGDVLLKSLAYSGTSSPQYKDLFGQVESNGTIQDGGGNGWSVVRNTTGTYTITFSPAFNTYAPTLLVTPAPGSDTIRFAYLGVVTSSSAVIYIRNNSGNLNDTRFHFQARGRV